jgi:hypothetical protein
MCYHTKGYSLFKLLKQSSRLICFLTDVECHLFQKFYSRSILQSPNNTVYAWLTQYWLDNTALSWNYSSEYVIYKEGMKSKFACRQVCVRLMNVLFCKLSGILLVLILFKLPKKNWRESPHCELRLIIYPRDDAFVPEDTIPSEASKHHTHTLGRRDVVRSVTR